MAAAGGTPPERRGSPGSSGDFIMEQQKLLAGLSYQTKFQHTYASSTEDFESDLVKGCKVVGGGASPSARASAALGPRLASHILVSQHWQAAADALLRFVPQWAVPSARPARPPLRRTFSIRPPAAAAPCLPSPLV